MQILREILDTIKTDYKIKKIVRGIKATAVLSKYCGLSSTMIRSYCCEDEDIEKYLIESARELAMLSLSKKIYEASIGIAAINSLLKVSDKNIKKINAFDIIKEKGVGKNVSIIGHFPAVKEIKRIAKNLWVFEKELRPGDLPEGDMKKYIPQSDIIAISGTVFINHSFENIIRLCPKKSIKIVLGASTPVSEVLFDYGVDYISGAMVRKNNETIKYVSLGSSFRQLAKKGFIEFITISKNKKIFKI